MRKRTKQHGLSMLAGLLMMAMLAGWMLSGPFEVEAVDATEVASEEAFSKTISEAGGNDVYIKLTADIVASNVFVWNNSGTLTVDLNNHTLSKSTGGLLQLSNGTLTITDSSSERGGTITSSSSSNNLVGTIETSGGTLNITGGNIKGENYVAVNALSNTTVSIENGTLEGNLAALKIIDRCYVKIGENSGNPKLQSNSDGGGNSTIIMQPSGTASDSNNSSKLVILGGEFLAETAGDYCYVCSVSGENNEVTISGGTFTLNADVGSTLVIGADMEDSNVSISGGTYNGRIARRIGGTTWDYSVYYGGKTTEGETTKGIIESGYVLTNNYLTNITKIEEEPYVFTAGSVSVVPGSLLKFDTRCSSLTTSTGDEETADLFSINPVSVGKDGTVYANSNANETPPTVGGESTDGNTSDENTYTFHHWIDSNNRDYSSSADYLAQNKLGGNTTLYAVWKANCSSQAGLQSATNCGVVSNVSGNLTQKEKYELGAGSWTVIGDNTVYSGGQSFYVTESGNYEFQRR